MTDVERLESICSGMILVNNSVKGSILPIPILTCISFMVLRHKHEIDSGRTSSVGMEILGFDAKSVPVPTMTHGRNAPWDEICGKAAKVLSFIDLAGHERYLKVHI